MTFWERGRLALARAMNLDLTSCQITYGRFLDRQIRAGVRWLDVGCGRQVVPEWAWPLDAQKRWAAEAVLIGVDVDRAMLQHPLLRARTFALGGSLPFAPNTFDLVTANMVVEHVSDPCAFLYDVRRVLRPGGRFVFLTPNYLNYLVFAASLTPAWIKSRIVWALERRAESDVFPTYYRLNTTSAVRRAARDANLEIEQLGVIGSVGSFARLGPVGWLECIPLKLVSLGRGCMRSDLLASLRKPGQ